MKKSLFGILCFAISAVLLCWGCFGWFFSKGKEFPHGSVWYCEKLQMTLISINGRLEGNAVIAGNEILIKALKTDTTIDFDIYSTERTDEWGFYDETENGRWITYLRWLFRGDLRFSRSMDKVTVKVTYVLEDEFPYLKGLCDKKITLSKIEGYGASIIGFRKGVTDEDDVSILTPIF